jgi:hypothetical protein
LKIISVYYHQFSGKTQGVLIIASTHAIPAAHGPLYHLAINNVPSNYLMMEILDLLIDRM